VFAILYKVMGNSREVEDVAQDVFIALYRNIRSFKQEAKFTTWLYRIAYNHGCSALRRKKTKKEQMLAHSIEREDGTNIDIPGDAGGDPQERILAGQVWDVVSRLPVQMRTVLELYYAQEKSYEEIAEILTIPLGTVKTQLFRARAELRKRVVENETTGSLS
jgi:RNA polymerase sigma-70 factor (ECF subfamily)